MKTLGKGQFLCTYNIVYQCSQHMRFSSHFLSNLLQISIICRRCWDQNRKSQIETKNLNSDWIANFKVTISRSTRQEMSKRVSKMCFFSPVKLVVNQLYLNAWTSWIKSNETIALCGRTLLFVLTVIPNLNWQNLKRNCCSSNFFKSNAVNTWWKSQVNFSWHENSHHFYDFYKWP